MLKVVRSMAELPFGKLMEIYAQSNCECGFQWGSEPDARRLQLAEQDFYAYLRQCFFTLPDSVYFLWEEQGDLVSAVRCESYCDGVLLAALETAPDKRNQGYATALVKAVLNCLEDKKVYVHIHRDNSASVAVHLHCGFVKMKRGARLLDGSYSRIHDTYLKIPDKTVGDNRSGV